MKFNLKNTLAALLVMTTFACKSNDGKSTEDASQKEVRTELVLPKWAENAVIYEVNMRQFTEEGTFNAFKEHLPRLKELGIDILWLMPIYPISETKRKGELGSYYSISDYKAVNHEFGTMDDFKKLVDAVHAQGMHIILDWVPNHTGWDHAWIKNNPEWYTQDKDGNVIDPTNPETGESWGWTDVADLNYDNMDMRKAMIADKLFWLNEIGIDGFRDDVAGEVPDAFWHQVKDSIIKNVDRDIFMLAEAEHPDHRNSKSFHMSYAWGFHHILNEIAKGKQSAKEVVKWFEEDQKKFNEGFCMHFTSNHDENTWNGTVFERMGDAHKSLAEMTYVLPGMPLIYGGQEEPMKHRLEFFTKDNIGFKNYDYADFYKKLNILKHNNNALLATNAAAKMTALNDHILMIAREQDGDKVIGIFNLSDKTSSVKLEQKITGKDYASGETKTVEQGTELSLGPWETIILQ